MTGPQGMGPLIPATTSHPATPIQIGAITPAGISGLTIHSIDYEPSTGLLVIVDSDAKAHTVDLASPTAPSLLQTQTLGQFRAVAITPGASHFFVAHYNGDEWVRRYSLSNPAAFTASGQTDLAFASYGGGGREGYLVGNYFVYFAERGNQMAVVDVTNPSAAVKMGLAGSSTVFNGDTDSVFYGGYYYAQGASSNSMGIAHVTAGVPALDATIANTGTSTRLDAAGTRLVTIGSSTSLKIWDLTAPIAPTQIGSTVNPAGSATAASLGTMTTFDDVALDPTGRYAYVCTNLGLLVLDCQTPTATVPASKVVPPSGNVVKTIERVADNRLIGVGTQNVRVYEI